MRAVVHIITKFEGVTGGGVQRAILLGKMLARHARVKLWSTHVPHPDVLKQANVTTIEPLRLQFPRSGTFVVVGSYVHVGRWIRWARPQRKIVILNTEAPDEARRLCGALAATGGPHCDIVYADEELRDGIGIPGTVQLSPIDIERFRPAGRPAGAGFTVGRMSRDYRYKFHETGPDLFRRMAGCGMTVRIMGGTCLAGELQGVESVALKPTGAESAVDFLHSLDCLLYRTRSDWYETFGRVVFEAMACGLPVICGARGGYAKYIKHGVNGYLFDDDDEAAKILLRLRDDARLRADIGRNARGTVERMYGPQFEEEIARYYVPR
ncbi:MAG: glycosyltransferase [Alphaproteobacteria bacterium]|nr:glycosyltransferase [Alphaproteobacteria bacterium]